MPVDTEISGLPRDTSPARTHIVPADTAAVSTVGVPIENILTLAKDTDVAFTDNTTGDVSPTKHGYAPKAPNDASKVLDGTGAYSKGGLKLLEEHAAANVAQLNFTTFINSALYDEYIFEFENLLPQTDGALLWMRMGTGSPSTFDTGTNYSYRYWRLAGATAVVTVSGATKIILTDGVGNNALWGLVGRIALYNPSSTSVRKMLTGQIALEQTSSGGLETDIPTAVYDSTTAVTGVQFLFSTGNIVSGTIRAYGVCKQ